MVNNSIAQGIKMAVDRGSTLQDAMISFYNAGYPKEDVEEAARAYQTGGTTINKPATPQAQPITKPTTPTQPATPPIQPIAQPTTPQTQNPLAPTQSTTPTQPAPTMPTIPDPNTPPQTPIKPEQAEKPKSAEQKASQYGDKNKKSNTKIAMVFLSLILVMLIIGLILLFLFKENIIGFFNKTL